MIPTSYKSTIATHAAPYVYRAGAFVVRLGEHDVQFVGPTTVAIDPHDLDECERAALQAMYAYVVGGILAMAVPFMLLMAVIGISNGLTIRPVVSVLLAIGAWPLAVSVSELPELDVVSGGEEEVIEL